ncbi:MAG: FGGY-family carbohydrate kinase [Gammaproteobacteria bacterium]
MPTSPRVPRPSALFLGLDVGTSGIRACVLNADAEVCAEASVRLAAPRHQGNAVEQDPQLWWSGLCTVIKMLSRKIDTHAIRALCLDGTSGTVLLCDAHGAPVSPGLMYNDARGVAYVDVIARHAPADSAVHSATSGLAKLLWLQAQGYAPQAQYFCHQADWLLGRLRGCYGVSDMNNSLKSGYDPVSQTWPAWLDELDIQRDRLPRVALPGGLLGKIATDMAEDLGLSPQTQVLAGSTDSTAAFMATGASRPGEAVTSLGSTLVLKVIAEAPLFDAAHGVYSQPLGDYWLVGGGSNSGGAVLRHFFSDTQMQAMQSQLRPQQPTGLDYYPLLRPGERFPHNDPHWPARLEPRPADDVVFFQGLLEGLTNIEHEGYRLLERLGAPYPEKIYSVGGGSVNPHWRQMRQHRLGVSIVLPAHTEAAYGMAQLAHQSWAGHAFEEQHDD